MKLLQAFNTPKRKKWPYWVAALGVLALVFAATVEVDISGRYEGIYVLRARYGKLLQIRDDIFLGQEKRLLWKVEFEGIHRLLFPKREVVANGTPFLDFEWDKKHGDGFVFNVFPDGRRLLTCFSRFEDSDGKTAEGLFVGGGLPYSAHAAVDVTMNETGMAFFDGREWRHLWCNVNEAISSGMNPAIVMSPSKWTYLGSRVLRENAAELVLNSSHALTVDGVPLRIDRFALFRAGEPYFVLAIKVTNAGQFPVSYYYNYGDEPWVGDFGTSVGNVGWVRDRIFYYEGQVDPSRYTFAGMYDGGNRMILGGELGTFSHTANFIEWLGANRPDLVYFSNRIGVFAQESEKVPLYSKNNRVLFLQWGPKLLQPNQTDLYMLAIGMAGHDQKSGLPVKPEVRLDPGALEP